MGEEMKKLQNFILFLTFIILFILCFCSVKKVVASINEKIVHIYLDAGHGGFDGGAISSDKKIIEKDITLRVCECLKVYLEKTGIKVSMTRSTDQALAKKKRDDILKRVELINKSNCDIYISIHANSYPSASIKGAQTFYNPNNDDNKLLASKIMKYIYMFDSTNKRTEKSITGKYLVDHTNKIGCLVELGFLTNKQDLAILTSDEKLSRLSLMIYLGILDYLEGISS